MLRYKLSAKIMFFFEIIAIPKRKNVIFAANIENSSKLIKIKKKKKKEKSKYEKTTIKV